MMTHLYCVLPNDERSTVPVGLRGLDEAPVRALTIDHLVAWVSDVEGRSAIEISGVKTHDAVVETALATGSTPVPARFGQRFASDAACRDALGRQAGAIETVETPGRALQRHAEIAKQLRENGWLMARHTVRHAAAAPRARAALRA